MEKIDINKSPAKLEDITLQPNEKIDLDLDLSIALTMTPEREIET
jgi:hypothetical protein